MKRNSLAVRTLLAFFLFAVVIVALLWFIQVHFFNINYERYQVQLIKDSAERIRNSSKEDLESTLESIAYDNNICVQYHYSFGKVENYNTKTKLCLLTNSEINILGKYRKQLVNDEDHYVRLHGPNNERAIVYAVDLGEGKLVLLNATLDDMSTATMLLKNQMIYISIVIIIFAIVLALIEAMHFTKPIISITDKAKEMGKGNYDVKFDKSNIAELNELSNVLSVAASEMKETDELRRDLLANVSHDLKTPLTMIKAYAEKVRDLT